MSFRYPAYRPIDMNRYQAEEDELQTYYGLPKHVAYCKSCVISNQRPNSAVEFTNIRGATKDTINFDKDGVCDACLVTQKKNGAISWSEREEELREICDRYRRNDGRYDCVVPGSGGKDSFYAAHVLKYKYGMRPLTITWAPHIYTEWGWRNFQAWINAGFDNILHTPNGRVHRLLTRLAVEELFHPFQPFMIGQKNIAPRAAIDYDISLVFYGENEAEYGNPIAVDNSSEQDGRFFATDDLSEIYLSGIRIDELIDEFGLHKNDLLSYLPVNPGILAQKKVNVHHLGYYLKWHPQGCYYYSVEHGGFEASPERTAGTYSKYNSIDDKIDDLHYYTLFTKFGIGRATYDAAQEIRNDEINREEGVALVKRFDGEFPERFFDEILTYLSVDDLGNDKAASHFENPKMDRDYFMHLCDRHRSPHIWKYENGHWKLRHAVKVED